MMKKALGRGGRLVTVIALAGAFQGFTAGANAVEPEPVKIGQGGEVDVAAGGSTKIADCRRVVLARDVKHTTRLGTQIAAANVKGESLVHVCWDLEVTGVATVDFSAGGGAQAKAETEAMAAEVIADSEEVCVSASASLNAAAGTSARATGTMTAEVIANTTANTSASASAGTLAASGQGTAVLSLIASVNVEAGPSATPDAGDLPDFESCTSSEGVIGA